MRPCLLGPRPQSSTQSAPASRVSVRCSFSCASVLVHGLSQSADPNLAWFAVVEDAVNGVHCKGLTETVVTSVPDVLRIIHRAQEKRRVGETKMNKASSRSHCIFTLTVAAKERVADAGDFMMDRVGKLVRHSHFALHVFDCDIALFSVNVPVAPRRPRGK